MNSLLQGTYKLPKKALSPAAFPYVKGAVFFLLSLYIFWTLRETNILFLISLLSEKALSDSLLFFLPFLLIGANYGVESLKWQLLVSRIQSFTFYQAVSGVLAGMAASFATPGGVGDYFGRVLSSVPGSRVKLPAVLLMCRLAQMLITVIFGSASLLILFVYNHFVPEYLQLLSWISVFSFFLISLGFVFRVRVVKLVSGTKMGNHLTRFIQVIAGFSGKEISSLFFLAFIRHTLYVVQFILLLHLFGASGELSFLFLAVNFIFLCKSFLPVFFELGAREYAAVLFFSFFSFPVEPALIACLVLWFFNIVIPSLAGLPFLLNLKSSEA